MSPDRLARHRRAEYVCFTPLPTVLTPTPAECGGKICTPQGYCALASIANCLDCSSLGINTLPCQNVTAKTTFVDMSHNGITQLSVTSLAGFSTLTYLTLAYNAISVINLDAFTQLTALTYLILSNNNIKALPLSVFSAQTALAYLDLDTNYLTVIPAGFFNTQTALTFLFALHFTAPRGMTLTRTAQGY